MMLITTPAISDSGIWSGIFDINGHGAYDFTGLITDNQATAYTKKAKVVYSGTINKEKKMFEWNLLMFLKNGSYFGKANIKGKIINNNIMSGSWVTSPAKDYGNIYLVKLDEKEVLDVGEIINKMAKLEIIKDLLKRNKIRKLKYAFHTISSKNFTCEIEFEDDHFD